MVKLYLFIISSHNQQNHICGKTNSIKQFRHLKRKEKKNEREREREWKKEVRENRKRKIGEK